MISPRGALIIVSTCSACENSGSGGALKITPHGVIRDVFARGRRLHVYYRKPPLQTEGVKKDAGVRACPGREGPMKICNWLHYGKCRLQCFWSLTLARDKKSQDINLDVECCSFNLSAL